MTVFNDGEVEAVVEASMRMRDERDEARRRADNLMFEMQALDSVRVQDNRMFINLLRKIAGAEPVEAKAIAQQYIAELEL